MGPNLALVLEIAALVALALLIVIVAVVFSPGGACDGAGGDAAGAGRVHAADVDVESALGGLTLMTYEQVAARKGKEKETETEKDEERERCAICLGEYGEGGALVQMVPGCGHFFHAECGIDGWLRKRRTCPLCRGGVLLPRIMPRPECPRMPLRITASS